MQLPPAIKEHFEELADLCKKYRVNKLYSFGSVNTDRFDPGRSDVDFLVELESMPPLEKGDTLMNLWDDSGGTIFSESGSHNGSALTEPIFQTAYRNEQTIDL